MAKQLGIIPLQGSIGNITFFKNPDGGYSARQKPASNAAAIASGANYVRTRENMAEFGTAGKAAKLISTAFAPVIQRSKDSRMFPRLLQNVMKGVRADTVSPRGERNMVRLLLRVLRVIVETEFFPGPAAVVRRALSGLLP